MERPAECIDRPTRRVFGATRRVYRPTDPAGCIERPAGCMERPAGCIGSPCPLRRSKLLLLPFWGRLTMLEWGVLGRRDAVTGWLAMLEYLK
eukprot:776314-Prorocentrum_minimum.AAC.2